MLRCATGNGVFRLVRGKKGEKENGLKIRRVAKCTSLPYTSCSSVRDGVVFG